MIERLHVQHNSKRSRGRICTLIGAIFLCCYCCMADVRVRATSFTGRQIIPLQTRGFGPRRQRQVSSCRNPAFQSPSRHFFDISLCSNTVRSKTNTKPNNNTSKNGSPGNANANANSNIGTILYFMKVGLAGGIAGAVGSAVLYPMDAAKTLRQSSPSSYSSVFHALRSLASTTTTQSARTWHVHNVYRGIIPACLGAIPSSALYFGAYESMKTVLMRSFPLNDAEDDQFSRRLFVHAVAAMSGNILSSAVFVPKELIKQQLQHRQSGNVMGAVIEVLSKKGLTGMYVGYKATLLRNIPTAVMRFTLYEEFRYRWYTKDQLRWKSSDSGYNEKMNKRPPLVGGSIKFSPKFFLAGAAAGALASGVMTPVDVIKTRMATGTCPVDVKNCFLHIVKEAGIVGLYSGAGSRMFFSGAFSAIGFGTFEAAKGLLGVSDPPSTPSQKKQSIR